MEWNEMAVQITLSKKGSSFPCLRETAAFLSFYRLL